MKRVKKRGTWGNHPHIIRDKRLVNYLERMPRTFDNTAKIIPKKHKAGNCNHRKNQASLSNGSPKIINVRVFGKWGLQDYEIMCSCESKANLILNQLTFDFGNKILRLNN